LHHSIDAKYHVDIVVNSVSVVVIREGVRCIDEEEGRGGGGGGGRRLRSSSGDILLGGLLCWNRLHRGRHGGVVVVVRGRSSAPSTHRLTAGESGRSLTPSPSPTWSTLW